MTFEEALRLRVGSLGIKRRCGRVGAHSTGRTVPLDARVTATWNVAPSGSLAVAKKLKEREMLHEPPMVQVAVIGLALLCVAVLFVAARSP
jgi:hypothetical protein